MQYMVLILCAITLTVSAKGHRHEHVLNIRQSTCNNNGDCLAENVSGPVPSRYVQCDSGVCVCSDCFERNDNDTCSFVSPGCYFFEDSECVDNRRSQLVAFLLSLFLGEVGAANFYIGQNGLAAGQLVLFLSTFIIICCGACLPLCCVCCILGKDGEGSTAGGALFGFCMVCVFLLIFAVSFAIIGWWIAEAVIFGTNRRDDGDGCPLNPDL